MIIMSFFRCLLDNGILPCIKVRKNVQVRFKKGHILRNLSVLEKIISKMEEQRKIWKFSSMYPMHSNIK